MFQSFYFFIPRPNVEEGGSAALFEIRNQAIILEYLLKNVGIYFDKNLASAAIALYPEIQDTTAVQTEGKPVAHVFFTANPSKRGEKCFLDLRNIFLNQENIRKFFSKQEDLSS